VIAEADGLVKYNDRGDLLAERERDHLLREAGYTVVHFTWRELFQTPEVVIARIRKALAAAEGHP
jgi:very-short-patch-repair endonuclease